MLRVALRTPACEQYCRSARSEVGALGGELAVACALQKGMARWLLFTIVALSSPATAGERGDPLESPQCRQALKAVEAEQVATAAAREADPRRYRGALERLTAARQRAAAACLRARAGVPPVQRGPAFQAPIAVPPVSTPPRAAPPPARSEAPGDMRVPLPPRTASSSALTSCDATGCWTSGGTRLQRVGPSLLGPNGFCTAHGRLVLCP